jgi:hypothetical protein
MPYKITSEVPGTGLISVKTESAFSQAVTELFGRIRPRRIIETGTYMGTGTTAIIGKALRRCSIERPEFYSIEVNPQFFAIAHSNVQHLNINVHLLCGLSVPRALLPSRQQIEEMYVRQQPDTGDLFVDWPAAQRADAYFAETDFSGPDDLLGKCLTRFDNAPQFVLLDSAGHMGNIEFRYVVDRLAAPCAIALDDTNHVKHHRSLQQMKADRRFRMLVESQEKFGFCVAEFDPAAGAANG